MTMKIIRKKTEESKSYMHLINKLRQYSFTLSLSLIFYVFSAGQGLLAQHKITSYEEQLFRQESLQRIKDLEDLLNQLLDAPSYERADLIKNATLPSKELYTKFKDDQVNVEDDFQTRVNATNKPTIKRIDAYLNDIGLNYGRQDNGEYKNKDKKILLKNIVASKIMAVSADKSMFIKVNFEVDYKGIDKRTNVAFRMPSRRVVEIQIDKLNGTWQFTIVALRFISNNEIDFSKNVVIENPKGIQPITPQVVIKVDSEKTIIKNSKIVLRAFKISEKWGIKDAETTAIIAHPTFDEIEEFSEDEMALVNIDGYWGFIDTKGNITIKCEYDNAESFSKEKKGKARVYKGMESFFIDKQGNKTK